MRLAEPGRRALLEAGGRLLGTQDLARLSVNAIVTEAGMAKGSFYQHWPARRDYLLALHRSFHDHLADVVDAATDGLPPGIDRLEAGMNAYLDGCLSDPATKALLVQARTDAELGGEVAARNDNFARIAAEDLAALDWQPAQPVATLVVAAIAEVALRELPARQRLDQLRFAVLRLASRTHSHSPETTATR